jgi:two-component system OmpR family response regulator
MPSGNPYLLLVEDDLDLAEVTAEILEQHGYEVSISPNGLAALHSLARRPADLILLDVMLPIMSGLEMLQEVRNQPGANSNVPVVLVTAMRELLEPGPGVLHDAIVTKPFEPAQLLRVIDELLKVN